MASRLLVLSSDPLARGGLRGLLSGWADLNVVADRAEAGDLEPELDAAVVDLGAGPLPAALLEADLPVVALVSDAARAVEAAEAGARAVLLRDGDGARIRAAVLAVCAGLTVVDEPFREALLRVDAGEGPEIRSDRAGEELTPREREVLGLLAQGLSNRALGRRLGISENTARFHVNSILAKLGARSRTDAVVRAARLGLVLI